MGDIHRTRTTEEFIPSSNWIEDSTGHYLYVHLPGFKKEEVMVGLAYPGYVTISGERIVNDDKCIYFAQALRLPENSNMNKIGQNFEGEMLYLTIPKREDEKDENPNHPTEENAQGLVNDENPNPPTEQNAQGLINDEGHGNDANEHKSEKTDDYLVSVHKDMRKDSILERAITLLKNNIILTVFLAFLLGVFVSRRFELNGQ